MIGGEDDVPAGEGPAQEPDEEIASAVEPAQIKRRTERAKLAKNAGREFWKRALRDPAGRMEIWKLLAEVGAFEERFACGPNGFPQPEATWFRAGEQAFGLRLFQSLAVIDREATFLMLDEHDPRFAKPKRVRKSKDD